MKIESACSKIAAHAAAFIPGEKPVHVTYDSAGEAFVIHVRDWLMKSIIERALFRYDAGFYVWADTTDHAETALQGVMRAYPQAMLRVAMTDLYGMYGMVSARELLLTRLQLLDADMAAAKLAA
jgi:hypothetical protein